MQTTIDPGSLKYSSITSPAKKKWLLPEPPPNALRVQTEARTDPAAVSAWSQKYNVDAEACRGILASRAERRPMKGNMHAIDTDNAQG